MTDLGAAPPSRDPVLRPSPNPRPKLSQELRVLRDPNVARLVFSRLVSDLGAGIGPIALAFGVLGLPGGGPSALGLVLFCAALPNVVFLLFAGVLADRGNRARILVVAELGMAIAQGVAAVLFISDRASVPALAALAALGGTASALFYPAHTGLIPQVVRPEQLQSTNALIRLSSNLARVGGVALGGILVATIGSGWALGLNASTYGISALLLIGIVVAGTVPVAATSSVLGELAHGWREFTSRRWVWLIVVVFSVSNVGFGAAVGVLGPVVALDSWNGAQSWALIMAAFSLGTVTGVVFAMRIRPKRPLRVAMLAVPLLALPIAGLIPPLSVLAIASASFLAGLAIDIFEVLWQTTLQQHIPQESLSRVSAYDMFGSLVFTPLGLAAAGPAIEAWGTRTTAIICTALVSLALLALLDPQIRSLRAVDPANPLGPPATAH